MDWRIASVAFALVLAGCSDSGFDAAEKLPEISGIAQVSDDGLTVLLTVVPGDLQWSELAVSARCTAPQGPVTAGQEIHCPGRGGMRIVHCATRAVLFQTAGDGSGEQGAAECPDGPGPVPDDAVIRGIAHDVEAGGNATQELAPGVTATWLAARDCELGGASRVASSAPAGVEPAGGALRYVSIEHDSSWDGCLASMRLRLHVPEAGAGDPKRGAAGLAVLYWTGSAWADLASDHDAGGVVRADQAHDDLRVFLVRTDTPRGLAEVVVDHASPPFAVVQVPGAPAVTDVLPGDVPTLPASTEVGAALIPTVDGAVCRTVDGLVGTIEGSSCVISCVLPDGTKGRLIDLRCVVPSVVGDWLLYLVLALVGAVVLFVGVWLALRLLRRRRRRDPATPTGWPAGPPPAPPRI